MVERRNYGVRTWEARGKPWALRAHAADGMSAERPRITYENVQSVLEHPDHDDGAKAWKRIGKRTIIVYYEDTEEHFEVRAVSATRRRLPP